MNNRQIKFRAWDIVNKEMEYIDDLYWLEENFVHSFSSEVIDFFWGSFRLNGDCIDTFVQNEHAAATGLTSLEKIGNTFENPELLKF